MKDFIASLEKAERAFERNQRAILLEAVDQIIFSEDRPAGEAALNSRLLTLAEGFNTADSDMMRDATQIAYLVASDDSLTKRAKNRAIGLWGKSLDALFRLGNFQGIFAALEFATDPERPDNVLIKVARRRLVRGLKGMSDVKAKLAWSAAVEEFTTAMLSGRRDPPVGAGEFMEFLVKTRGVPSPPGAH